MTAYGAYRFAVNLGFALGPAAAGFLADRSFTYLFLGDAASSVAFGVLALAVLPHGVRTRGRAGRGSGGYRTVVRDRTFLLLMGGTLASAFVYMQEQSTFALHVRSVGLSNAAYGWLLALNGLLVVAIELPLTGLTQRFRRPRVMALGIALVGSGFALVGLAGSAPALAATVVVWTVGEMVSAPMASAYVADLAPPALRGRYMGAQGMVWGLAAIAGPTLGTLMFGANPALLWGLCGVLGLAGAWLVLASGRRAARRPPAPAGGA